MAWEARTSEISPFILNVGIAPQFSKSLAQFQSSFYRKYPGCSGSLKALYAYRRELLQFFHVCKRQETK